MNPYAVVRCTEDNMCHYTWRPRTRGEPEDANVYGVCQQTNVALGEIMSGERHVHWVINKEEAMKLAEHMASRFAGSHWMVMELKSDFHAVIERTKRSDFSPEKGLTPA